MLSVFIYENASEKLNTSTLKPNFLALLFNLDIATIVLEDNDGNLYVPTEEAFEPELKPNKTYIIRADRVQERNHKIVPRNRNVEIIQGDQRDVNNPKNIWVLQVNCEILII